MPETPSPISERDRSENRNDDKNFGLNAQARFFQRVTPCPWIEINDG